MFKLIDYMHFFKKMLQQNVFDITQIIIFQRDIN